MSALAEKSRDQAKAKAKRLTTANSGSVDASNWRESTDEKGDVQTGPRPISRRQFKRGGKVAGTMAAARADRKPRKAGGALTANSLINRDVKSANEERAGSKHIGGMRRGGRTHKDMGGLALPAWSDAVSRATGGRTGKECGGPMMGSPRPMPTMGRPMMRADGGRTAKKGGGSLDGTIQGARPAGGRLARKGGGRAKKGMNVNIIIAPASAKPAMPTPGPIPPGVGPVGLHQGAPPPMPPGAGAPMGPPAGMPPMGRKSGGRAEMKGRAYPIDSGAGGGLGRLEKARAYG